MPIKTAQEMMPNLLARRKEGQCLYVKNGYLIVDYSYPYEIALDRIDTPEKILGWVCHLSEKNWMSADKLTRFIEVCGEINGVNYREFN